MITGPSHAVPRYLSALFQTGTPAALSNVELLVRFAARPGETDETAELAFAALPAGHGPMVLLVTAAVLMAGLVTTGAGVMGYSATRQENPPRAGDPGQEARQPATSASQVLPGAPRPAVAKPATDQGPLVIRAEVVDPEGHRLSGADVVVTFVYARSSGTLEMVPQRARSDAEGQARLEAARERAGATLSHAVLLAYQPGRAIAMASVGPRPVLLAQIASPPVIPLTLAQPARWTITVLGPEDRPIAGLRLAPTILLSTVGRTTHAWDVPDALLEPMTATTDARGVATPTYLPPGTVPRSIQVSGPELAPHTVSVKKPQGNDIVLKLGRPGRLVGLVRTASGQPMADIPVEIWVRGWGTIRSADRVPERITPDAILRLGPQPLKTGPQGAFQTPPTLLNGQTYRVSIRHDGFVPFLSDWVTLDGERTTLPPIRLQPLRNLTGQLKDRQGRAVAGARVFLPADGPSTTTDAEGRFALAGINPGKTVILAEKAGFRLQGWLVDPSAQADVGPMTLTRGDEAHRPVMKPLPDPIPPEESRALADRLLEPYLREAPENGDERPRMVAIAVLGEFDPGRALDLFQNGNFRDEDSNQRESLAASLAEKAPAAAEAMVEAIANPLTKADAFASLARALPASERARKLALLDRATTLLRDRLQQANPTRRLRLAAEIAEQCLDLGERDRARLVIQAGKTIFDPMTRAGGPYQTRFPAQLARLEPVQAREWLQRLPKSRSTDAEIAEVSDALATDDPAEAERVFNLRDGTADQFPSHYSTMRLCRRLARVDPTRARGVAASVLGRGQRVCAWAFVALGLAEKGNADASEALDRAIQEIDRLRESGPGPDPVWMVGSVRLMYPTNPAALILPIVERIAPDRLADVFWRAVALHPRLESDREDQLRTAYIGFECMLLSRYDRALAAALFEPMNSYLEAIARRKGPSTEFDASHVVAMACLDPRAAVALLESLPPEREFPRFTAANSARFTLAEALGLPPEKRWMRLWHTMAAHLPLDD
jgi:hypothetical protein